MREGRKRQGWGKGEEVSLPHSKFLDRPLLQWHIRKIGLVCHPTPSDTSLERHRGWEVRYMMKMLITF